MSTPTESPTPATLTALPPVLPLRRAAELLGVTTRTVARWIASGRVRATRTTPAGSGRVLVDRDSLLRAVGLLAEPRR